LVQSTDKDIGSIIESAMRRLPPDASSADAEPDGARKNLGRRDYDLALARRLEQLKTAMGEDLPAVPAAPGRVPLPRRTFGSGTLVATALISALLGSGLTWTMSAGSKPTAPPPTRTISAAPAPPTPAASAPVVPPAPARSDEDLARQRLETWRLAWSNRDGDAYLRQYSPDFTPADGQKHADWAAARRKNLASRSDISVQIRDLHIERLADDRLQLVFLQDYVSGSYRETGQRKTLLLVRHDSGWLIAGEWQGGARTGTPGN